MTGNGPHESKYNEKICMIIPIRDREYQLEEIVPRVEEVLIEQNLDYRIYVIEQGERELFNIGKLINIGFIESQRDQFSDYYVKTDVDIYPITNDVLNYSPYDGVKHLYGHLHTIGGVFSFDKASYIKTNGHSNEYFGWGWEDVDFLERLRICNIEVDKSAHIERRTSRLIHDAITKANENSKNETKESNQRFLDSKIASYKEDIGNIKNDGLNSCNYEIIERYHYKDNPQIIRIIVDV